MHAVVVANGDLPDQASREHLGDVHASADLVIAADGGLVHCAELGWAPHLLVGDLDSAPPELVDQARSSGTEVMQYPANKDMTDLDLALCEALDAGADQITVVAAFGGRLDHELATIALLTLQEFASVSMRAFDGRRSLWVVRSTIELALPLEATVSLLPWAGDVEGVTTAGLQWPLTNAMLTVGSTRGVSNVASEPTQSVSIRTGVLLAVTDTHG